MIYFLIVQNQNPANITKMQETDLSCVHQNRTWAAQFGELPMQQDPWAGEICF